MVTLILTRIVFVLSIPLCLYAVYFGVVALFGLRKNCLRRPRRSLKNALHLWWRHATRRR